jgi:hypothetical protein
MLTEEPSSGFWIGQEESSFRPRITTWPETRASQTSAAFNDFKNSGDPWLPEFFSIKEFESGCVPKDTAFFFWIHFFKTN